MKKNVYKNKMYIKTINLKTEIHNCITYNKEHSS